MEIIPAYTYAEIDLRSKKYNPAMTTTTIQFPNKATKGAIPCFTTAVSFVHSIFGNFNPR